MPRHFHLAPDGANDALFIDEEGSAIDTHVFAPVHALFDPGAVGLADLALEVGGEREGESVLRFELVMGGDAVARDADHGYAGLGKVGHTVPEGARLDGAAGRQILWIEIENHL